MSNRKVKVSNPLGLMKDWALKSGYPIENDVADILSSFNENRTEIERSVAFYSFGENGERNIRSIDFECKFIYESQNIPSWHRYGEEALNVVFIIDAKYSHDEVYWFLPSAGDVASSNQFLHLIPEATEKTSVFEKILRRDDLLELPKIQNSWVWAASGQKVKEQSKERNSLASSQMQMITAVHDIISKDSRRLETTVGHEAHYFRDVFVYYPIIVTNAQMYLLNSDIPTKQVKSAKAESSLCKLVDSLLVEQPHLYTLRKRFDEIKKDVASCANGEAGLRLTWTKWNFDSFPVIFTNLTSLRSVISSILERYKEIGETQGQGPDGN